MSNPHICHHDFVREWRLQREITHASGENAQFEGVARLTPRWAYEERGTLQIAAGGYLSTRRYQWAPIEGGFAIRFEDGREFHTMSFAGASSPQTTATHVCPPDLYRVRYDLAHFPIWTSTWAVTGPRKDYTMTSRYSPVSPQERASSQE